MGVPFPHINRKELRFASVYLNPRGTDEALADESVLAHDLTILGSVPLESTGGYGKLFNCSVGGVQVDEVSSHERLSNSVGWFFRGRARLNAADANAGLLFSTGEVTAEVKNGFRLSKTAGNRLLFEWFNDGGSADGSIESGLSFVPGRFYQIGCGYIPAKQLLFLMMSRELRFADRPAPSFEQDSDFYVIGGDENNGQRINITYDDAGLFGAGLVEVS